MNGRIFHIPSLFLLSSFYPLIPDILGWLDVFSINKCICRNLLFYVNLLIFSYEPELHPGVTYKLFNPKATLKIFSTGGVTITGTFYVEVQYLRVLIISYICYIFMPLLKIIKKDFFGRKFKVHNIGFHKPSISVNKFQHLSFKQIESHVVISLV